jgi:hypothetical protein
VREGIESSQQLSYLLEQKCTEIQGFLLSLTPQADDCDAFLQAAKLVLIQCSISSKSRIHVAYGPCLYTGFPPSFRISRELDSDGLCLRASALLAPTRTRKPTLS